MAKRPSKYPSMQEVSTQRERDYARDSDWAILFTREAKREALPEDITHNSNPSFTTREKLDEEVVWCTAHGGLMALSITHSRATAAFRVYEWMGRRHGWMNDAV